MTTINIPARTWNAAIIVEGEALPIDLTDILDLQAETVAAALKAAASLLRHTWERLEINTYKSTAAHGEFVPDRSWLIRWSPRTRSFVAEKNGCPARCANPYIAL